MLAETLSIKVFWEHLLKKINKSIFILINSDKEKSKKENTFTKRQLSYTVYLWSSFH